MSGRAHVSYITKVTSLDSNITSFKKDDILLISKVACDIATSPTSPYKIEGKRYYNIPQDQVIGIFKGSCTLNSLTLLKNSVLFEKINKLQTSSIYVADTHTMLGRVLKKGEEASVNTGDIIVLKDNMVTPIRLDDKEYFAAEDRSIVGIFSSMKDLSIQNMKIINGYILMKPYVSRNVLNSTILETPEINYEDLDYSDVHNRDLFKVAYLDKSIRDIHKDSILILNRDYTNCIVIDHHHH
jgi:co-chaperonin GroES (HSP10)